MQPISLQRPRICTWPLCSQPLETREGTEQPSGHPGCHGDLALAFVVCKEPGRVGLSGPARRGTMHPTSCALSDDMTLRSKSKCLRGLHLVTWFGHRSETRGWTFLASSYKLICLQSQSQDAKLCFILFYFIFTNLVILLYYNASHWISG